MAVAAEAGRPKVAPPAVQRVPVVVAAKKVRSHAID